MTARLLAILALLVVSTATSCSAFATYVLTPPANASVDSVSRDAFGVVARVAAARDLRVFEAKGEYAKCFVRQSFFLCEKLAGSVIEFQIRQGGTAYFTPWADSLRSELVDSLRGRFGPFAVLERH